MATLCFQLRVQCTLSSRYPPTLAASPLMLPPTESLPMPFSTLDDPALFSAILPLSYFFTEHQHGGMRWTLCAKELCYKNALLGQFFQSGKTLPIERGVGLDQLSLRSMGRAVGRGDWLHLFPESRVNYTGTLGTLRWGVGKVICDAMRHSGGRQPTVLPFYHTGMGEVMPYRAVVPSVGRWVHILVGQPVELEDISCRCNRPGHDQKQVWRELTARIGQALQDLEARAPPNLEQPEGVKRHGGTPRALAVGAPAAGEGAVPV
ncbi:PGA6 [Auxenochlorella protothecoides x Auxenochlorella symbiontica]|uniref:Tafazzin family protein n=2 Tax=Auxenochlorella protothecoides TaxID=3075 RepID=A0A1D1ZYY4_AUXPR